MARLLNFQEAQMFVRDGELFMIKDGKPAKDYIKNWQADMGVEDDTPVRVITGKPLDELIEDANMARAWGA